MMKRSDQLFIVGGIIVVVIILLILLWVPEDLTGKPTATIGPSIPGTPSVPGTMTTPFQCFNNLFPNPSVSLRLKNQRIFFTLEMQPQVESITVSVPGSVQQRVFGRTGIFSVIVPGDSDIFISCSKNGQTLTDVIPLRFV